MSRSDENEILENVERLEMQERVTDSLAKQQKLRDAGDQARLALDRRLEEIQKVRTAAWTTELIATKELDVRPLEDMPRHQYAAE